MPQTAPWNTFICPKARISACPLVEDKSWGAYNYYQGNNQSKIEVNTDLPVSIGNALVLGCHEGYPGHHVQGIYNERNFRAKGWAEYSVAPLYMPSSPLNEGGGDFRAGTGIPGRRAARVREIRSLSAGRARPRDGRYQR